METIQVVQAIALVSTIGFFLSGVTTCMRVYKLKSVVNVNFLPYLMTFMNCVLWTIYGVLTGDMLQCAVNGTGLTLQAVFMFIYLQNSVHPTKGKHCQQLSICLAGVAFGI